jgi:hypothetical protein|tara:strand:- start:146 stop:769 length:624 start_codon:yes stop_codon:yes gene_type:complete
MDLKNIVITGGLVADIAKELDIEILDWSYFLGVFSAGLTRLRSKPDKPLDHNRALLVRYIARTYPQTRRIATTTTGTLAPRGKGSDDTGFDLLEQMIEVYEEHPYGLEIGGKRLDLGTTAHLGALLGRNYLSTRNYMSGETALTTGNFRWVDVILSRFEISTLRGVARDSLPKKRIPDPEVDLIQELLIEEAEAHGIDPASLLKKGW